MPAIPPCDTVIALWGQVTGSEENLATNARLVAHTEALAEVCGARRVLHFSSSAVYGPGTRLSESDHARPVNTYGAAKLAMEQAVQALSASPRRHCCLRVANVIGAENQGPKLVKSAGPVHLHRFANGEGPVRSYISPKDLADILRALCDLPPGDLPECLNVTAPQPLSMESIMRAAERPIHWQTAPDHAVQSVTLDGSRLARLLPFLYLSTTADQMIHDWHSLETRQ